MKTIRTLTATRSNLYRLLLTFAMAFIGIAGLLAMHTVVATASHEAHGTHETIAIAEMGSGEMAGPTAAVAPDMLVAPCVGACEPGGAGEHSMLLMVCALALLAAVIILVLPGIVARIGAPPGIHELLERSPRALSWPRPPSLLVLSISRT